MPANGQYTQADLVLAEPRLGWPKGWLTARAARAWWAIKAWFQLTYGLTVTFNEGYRPLATQVFYWNLYQSGQGNPAAYPGNSKHGTGEAWDLDWPFTSWATSQQAAWRANEARFGISSAQGVADGEPWHKVNVAETSVAGGGATIIGGFLMALSDAEQAEMLSLLRNLAGFTYAGGKSAGDPTYLGVPGTIYQMLKQPVMRTVNGKVVPIAQIQDNADTRTIVERIENAVNKLAAAGTPAIDYTKLTQALKAAGVTSAPSAEQIAAALAPAVANELAKRLAN
ncbi:M15 family metallopeptidase [Leifsonia virtsii]|uniref:M15 family metallopeptidase n=1 Tax=Leifsonia virtsii TaxID=3035915 RepID=A0ABT8J051_9MICO|nr:M15 family metallopeptidase [Leifsonia virtsii]MDN4598449.1 M15 family metallopeptidase [Leifsonia virtsii]